MTQAKNLKVIFDSSSFMNRINHPVMNCSQHLKHLHICISSVSVNDIKPSILPFAPWVGNPLSLLLHCSPSGSSRTLRGEVCPNNGQFHSGTGPSGGQPTDLVTAFAPHCQMIEPGTPDPLHLSVHALTKSPLLRPWNKPTLSLVSSAEFFQLHTESPLWGPSANRVLGV